MSKVFLSLSKLNNRIFGATQLDIFRKFTFLVSLNPTYNFCETNVYCRIPKKCIFITEKCNMLPKIEDRLIVQNMNTRTI